MGAERIHRSISDDGIEIAARVQGQGPPLVLVHGALGDGDVSWETLLPHLTEHFTCYPLSLRGRGLSAPSSDMSHERLVEDVARFADSIGQPVGMMGHSSGCRYVLCAAARGAAISALALYEPALPELEPAAQAGWLDAFARIDRLAADGRLADGAQIMLEEVALANDDELAAIAAYGRAEALAHNVPGTLQEAEHVTTRPILDGLLERLEAPVALLRGARTHPVYAGIVDHLAQHLADAQVIEIAGAGHIGPQLAPEPVAREVTGFFSQVRTAA